MPWQAEVLDVALEVDPTSKRLVFRDVVLTVPRQSGKSTLLLVLILLRGLSQGRQNVRYGADGERRPEESARRLVAPVEGIGVRKDLPSAIDERSRGSPVQQRQALGAWLQPL